MTENRNDLENVEVTENSSVVAPSVDINEKIENKDPKIAVILLPALYHSLSYIGVLKSFEEKKITILKIGGAELGFLIAEAYARTAKANLVEWYFYQWMSDLEKSDKPFSKSWNKKTVEKFSTIFSKLDKKDFFLGANETIEQGLNDEKEITSWDHYLEGFDKVVVLNALNVPLKFQQPTQKKLEEKYKRLQKKYQIKNSPNFLFFNIKLTNIPLDSLQEATQIIRQGEEQGKKIAQQLSLLIKDWNLRSTY
ncbi:MAG: hypothetical protein KBD63_02850 [Bacteriovoracaceae bacterium]|nr:hypothetical protein [Bacteriovoracaceae bacterium]